MPAGVQGVTTELILYAFVVFLLAGVVKGCLGIGMPTTAIGILSQIIDPRLAIMLAIVPVFGANIWQVYRAGQGFEALLRYKYFALSLFVVMYASSLAAANVNTSAIVFALGVIIVIFAVTSLVHLTPKIPEKFDKTAQLIGGVTGGVSGGLTTIWGPPMVIYLLGRGVEKDEFVRATGVLLVIGSIPLMGGYITNGLMDAGTLQVSAMMLIPVLLGFAVGEKLRRRFSTELFRKILLYGFLIIGLNLLRRSLF